MQISARIRRVRAGIGLKIRKQCARDAQQKMKADVERLIVVMDSARYGGGLVSRTSRARESGGTWRIVGREGAPFMVSRRAIIIGGDVPLKAMLCRILEPKQWVIQEAADNPAALRLVEARQFDLIVTNEETSAKEDVGFLRKIRGLHPHTRVIILTDETTPADVISAIREHAFSYFSKPVSLPLLASIVDHAIEEPCWDDGIEIVSATLSWVCLRVRCEIKTAERLMQFFHEMTDLPEAERDVLATAFRELVMNAIEHGGKFDPQQYVEISFVRTRRAVALKIKDPGEGFSMEEIPHAAIMNPPDEPLRHLTYREAENLRPGGFGVLLVKNSIDELLYNEKGNEVVLVKYLDPVQPAAS